MALGRFDSAQMEGGKVASQSAMIPAQGGKSKFPSMGPHKKKSESDFKKWPLKLKMGYLLSPTK